MIRTPQRASAALAAALLLLSASACGGTGDETSSSSIDLGGDPGDCTVVDMAVSPEKIDLINALAKTFNSSDEAKVDGKCIFVRPQKKSSGAAAQLLYGDWNEAAEGPRPVI